MSHNEEMTLNPSNETAARFQAVVDTVIDAIITIDDRGIIDFANQAAEKIFGYSQGELIGHNVRKLMPEPDSSRHDSYIQAYLRTGVAKVIGIGRQVVGRRKDGSVFPMELAVSELHVTGQRLFTGVLRDKTDLRNSQQQLQEVQKLAASASIHQANAESLKMIHRELRAPLAAILNHSEQLLEEALSESQRGMAGDIKQNVQNLLRLISRSPESSSFLKDQGSVLDVVPCEPNTLVEQLREEFNACATSRGATWEVESSPDLPPVCWTDPTQVRQILVLILESGLDASAGGEICLGVHTNIERSEITFELTFSGWKISQERLMAIFSTTESVSTTQLSEGIGGFGLPLAQRLTERIGGRLTSYALGSAGSRFSLQLPITERLIRQVASDRTKPEMPPRPETPWYKKQVLLAEDTRENQVLIQHMLMKLGMYPVIVNSGFAAVTETLLAETAGKSFDLILMDIQMPGMNGWDATRRLRASGLTMPVIAITSLDSPKDLQECLNAGCQEVLTKPVSYAKFREVLQHWLAVNPVPVT